MKKINYFIAVAAVFLASCSNNDEPILSENQQSESVRVTYIRADANEDATTRGSVDGTTAAFTWNTGDKIAVYAGGYKISDGLESTYNAATNATFAFSGDNAVTESNRANFAIFPASLVWDGTSIRSGSASDYTATSLKLTLPASYTLAQVQDDVSPTPMIATNAPNGDLSFKALCPLLRVTVVNIPKQTKRIEFDFNGNKVQGEFALTGVTPGTTAIATSVTDGADDIITVTMADNTTWHDNLVINLPVPTGTYGNITITAYDATSDGHAVLTLTKPIKSTGWTPTRKSSRKMTATLPVFSVSAGKKVVFAPGNLQYQASTSTWRFAEHQYDYVGDATKGNVSVESTKSNNASVSSSYTGWIDLFGWGTSGSAPSGQTARAPYYTTKTSAYYVSNITTSGASWGENSEWDWGHNAISNGGNTADTWRTLTSDEWVYLINVDNSGSYRQVTVGSDEKAPYGNASVNGVYGLVLLPDGWDGSVHSGFSYGKSSWSNVYTESSTPKWSEMESAGCVFLPAAGYRSSTTVGGVGSVGGYWSSTASGSSSAYCLYFGSGSCVSAFSDNRYVGYSVRLVQNLN